MSTPENVPQAPPTYPLRPINGGKLELARPKRGTWYAELKYNGWRLLYHRPSRTLWNRHLAPSSLGPEFAAAMDQLDTLPYEWLDMEGLERRHGIGKGCLILLDILDRATVPYENRIRLAEHGTLTPLGLDERPSPGRAYLSTPYPQAAWPDVWAAMQKVNETWGADFYEGLVAKRADSLYPFQLTSPEAPFPGWMKHRWRF